MGEIIIILKGGIARSAEFKGMKAVPIEIHDYDVQGIEDDDLTGATGMEKDAEGDTYWEYSI